MSRVTVTAGGETATDDYTTGPIFPAATEVTWASLKPQPGEDLHTVLQRCKTPNARVVLPAGTFPWRNNLIADVNHYSVLTPVGVVQLVGAGIGKTILALEPNSFQYKINGPSSAHKLPAATGYGTAGLGIRIGAKLAPVVLADLTIQGSQQAGNDGLPMVFKVFEDYQGRGSIICRVEMFGIGHSNGNSPNVGEMPAFNLNRSEDCLIHEVTVDGQGVGGSPLGMHGSKRTKIVRSSFKGSPWSGVTSSYANNSGPTEDSASGDFEFTDCDIVGNGTNFPPLNIEQNFGILRYTRGSIQNQSSSRYGFDAPHISILSQLASGAQTQLIVTDVDVNPIGPNAGKTYGGAIVIASPLMVNGLPETIKAENIFVYRNGGRLTPRLVYDAPPSWSTPIDPTKEYVLVRRATWG